jgi:hypothetical protein
VLYSVGPKISINSTNTRKVKNCASTAGVAPSICTISSTPPCITRSETALSPTGDGAGDGASRGSSSPRNQPKNRKPSSFSGSATVTGDSLTDSLRLNSSSSSVNCADSSGMR